MATILLSFIGPLIFLVLKAANNGIRFSDTNVYFYTAQELLKGKLLYKDVFFTNLPLFPYVSSLYSQLVGNRLDLYYLTAAVECIITSLLLFFYAYKKTKNICIAGLTQTVYLFSFIVLSTSDHQTGVFLASLLSVAAFVSLTEKKYFFAGIFLGFMMAVKAYYFPVTAGIVLYVFLFRRHRWFSLIMGLSIALVLSLVPFLVLTPRNFIRDVFWYSLFRSQGVSKLNLLSFFISHDLVLTALFCFSLFNYKKNPLLVFINVFSVLMVLFYKDVYYLYINVMVPFLAIGIIDSAQQIFAKKLLATYVCIGASICLLAGMVVYVGKYASLQKIADIDDYVNSIKQEKPRYLYGVMEITSALAYLTNTPLLNNIIDTNENLFNSHLLKAADLTRQAVNSRTIIVSKGVSYPLENLSNPLATESIDPAQVKQFCSQLRSYPITTEGAINTIVLFKCYP